MSLTRNGLLARAAHAEAEAANVSDAAISKACLELAGACRDMASRLPERSDQELEAIAERMVETSTKKL